MFPSTAFVFLRTPTCHFFRMHWKFLYIIWGFFFWNLIILFPNKIVAVEVWLITKDCIILKWIINFAFCQYPMDKFSALALGVVVFCQNLNTIYLLKFVEGYKIHVLIGTPFKSKVNVFTRTFTGFINL